MIKLENYEVVGWEHAVRGMRNPMNSWKKSDSDFKATAETTALENGKPKPIFIQFDALGIGPNDHELMMKLVKGGPDHRKYLRYIDVYVDITAPFYFWKEFKTYRKGRMFMDDGDEILDPEEFEMFIETNSCSTMHKIHEKEFTMDDFSHEHLRTDKGDFLDAAETPFSALNMLEDTITVLNTYRKRYLETKDKQYWWQIIQLLPSSYNQKRTVKLNYEVLTRMYHARKAHKLDEWVELCKWIETLPYSEIITGPREVEDDG